MIASRELSFESGLDLGHERRRVRVTPRGVLAERVAVPLLEVGEPGLGDQLDRHRPYTQ